MCDGPRIGLSSLALPSHCQALRNVELRKEEGGDPTGANLAVGRKYGSGGSRSSFTLRRCRARRC
jgi:hypothetical protein